MAPAVLEALRLRTGAIVTRAFEVWAVAILAACASTPAIRPPFDAAPIAALDTAAFPGAATLLFGFAPRDEDPALRVGDAALLGVEISNGDTVDRLLLLLEVTSLQHDAAVDKETGAAMRPSYTASSQVRTRDPATGRFGEPVRHEVEVHPVLVALTRLDAMAQPQQKTQAMLFEEALGAGFWPYADAAATERESDLAGLLTRTLQGLVAEDDVLQDLMFRIVERPSLWSIAMNLGVGVTLAWRNVAEREFVELGGDTPVRRAQLDLHVNDGVAAFVDLAVAKPDGAAMVCGGLVGAIVRHPSKPDRTAVVRLLATRRGPVLLP